MYSILICGTVATGKLWALFINGDLHCQIQCQFLQNRTWSKVQTLLQYLQYELTGFPNVLMKMQFDYAFISSCASEKHRVKSMQID